MFSGSSRNIVFKKKKKKLNNCLIQFLNVSIFINRPDQWVILLVLGVEMNRFRNPSV